MPASTGTENELSLWTDPERDRLLAELATLNEELATAELYLADLALRVRAFAAFHDRLLAPLYAELDEVNAEVAELLAERSGSTQDREDAARARELAHRSAEAARAATAEPDEGTEGLAGHTAKPRPSEDARQRFRALIKLCHPDLAGDDAERERRERFTRLVNDAYASNDTARLDDLSRQWRNQGEDRGGQRSERSAADLVVSIGAARVQLAEMRAETATLAGSSLGRLLLERADPIEAVRSAARRVDDQIKHQREVLRGLAAL
jgi:hypothetical protein